MSEFKEGDFLVCKNANDSSQSLTLGKGYRALKGTNSEFVMVEMDTGGIGGMCHWRFKLSDKPNPVRTKTVTEIVSGTYGIVEVGKHDESAGLAFVHMTATTRGFMRSAQELTDAIDILSAIRDALQEQDK